MGNLEHEVSVPPPGVLKAFMAVLGMGKWTSLVWDMHHTARSGLSFSTFQNVLQLADIEAGIYQIDYDTLLEVNPTPCLLYADALHGFVLLKAVTAAGVTWLVDDSQTGFMERENLEKSWDGKILALGEIPVPPFSFGREAQCLLENSLPEDTRVVVLNLATDQTDPHKPWLVAGNLSPEAFKDGHGISFECAIPGPFRELTLLFSAMTSNDPVGYPIRQIRIPIAFEHRLSILRFYFSGIGHSGFDVAGIKGSVQGLFRIASPKN